VTINGETRYLGSFTREEDAAIAVDDAIIKHRLNAKLNFPLSPTTTTTGSASGAATAAVAMTTSPSSGSDFEDGEVDPYAAVKPKSVAQELPPPLHALLAAPTMKTALPVAAPMPPPPPSPRLMMSNKRSFSVDGPGAHGSNTEDIRQKTIGALWKTSSSPSFQQDEGIKTQVRKTMRAVQTGEADSLLAGIFKYGNYSEDQYPELAIMLLTEFGSVSSSGKSS
jgi:hypothetical protein